MLETLVVMACSSLLIFALKIHVGPLFPFFLLFTHFLYMHILIMLRVLCEEFGQWSKSPPCVMWNAPWICCGCLCSWISPRDRCRYSAVCVCADVARWREPVSVFTSPTKSTGSFIQWGFSALRWDQSLVQWDYHTLPFNKRSTPRHQTTNTVWTGNTLVILVLWDCVLKGHYTDFTHWDSSWGVLLHSVEAF